MTGSATVEPQPEPTEGHHHDWHLVSVETDGKVEVREYLCTGCPAVWIE